MSHFHDILAVGVLSAAVVSVCRVIYNLYLHPLRNYPGPKSWAATRLTWARAMQSGNYHLQLHELHKRYGPVVRVAPDELSYINAEAWKDIYSNRNISKNRVWAGQEEEHHPISIVSTDEATHLRNRRALTGAFTKHAIAEHAPVFEGLIDLLIQKFEGAVVQGQGSAVTNLTEWMNWLTFDISGALSFGESFGSVAESRAHPWVEISCSFGKGIALLASVNFFRPLNKLMKLGMPKEIMAKMDYHRKLAHEKTMQRLKMEDKMEAQDYVGSIMAYNEGKGEVKIPKEEIEANMTLLIFAGSETTSTAMTAILTQLLQSPMALEKLKREVRLTYRTEDEITIASVAKLEYLTAVIQEGIRMGPPAAILLPRVISKEGAYICGQLVPGNTFVSVNQYPTFRSTLNFEKPDSFIPERFLPDSLLTSDRLDAFEPFLLGRHKCIGQKLAWTIMRLTLARLIFTFDLRAVEELRDFGEQKTYIFWEKRPLMVSLRLRDAQ